MLTAPWRDPAEIRYVTRRAVTDAGPAGAGLLYGARGQARNAGSHLQLAAPQPQVQQSLANIWDADGASRRSWPGNCKSL